MEYKGCIDLCRLCVGDLTSRCEIDIISSCLSADSKESNRQTHTHARTVYVKRQHCNWLLSCYSLSYDRLTHTRVRTSRRFVCCRSAARKREKENESCTCICLLDFSYKGERTVAGKSVVKFQSTRADHQRSLVQAAVNLLINYSPHTHTKQCQVDSKINVSCSKQKQ